MIEKMKKVFVVSSASKKEQMLDALMDLGVLHIAEKKNADRELLDRFAALTKTDLLLKEYAEKKQKPAPVLSDEEFEKNFAELESKADQIGVAKLNEYMTENVNRIKAEFGF